MLISFLEFNQSAALIISRYITTEPDTFQAG